MIDLATLVAPITEDRFLAEHWPGRIYWSQEGVERRLDALAEIAELASAEAALAKARRVVVFRPDGKTAQVPDGAAAMPLYRLGLTCYFGTRHIAALRESTRALAADLGLPAAAVRCEIFCSSGESGVTMHSDFDVNFALLVRGHKRWRVAENHNIRNQTAVCRPGNEEPPDPAQLELADHLPFPDRMPDDAHELEFRDGGLLFMPRGMWHETRAQGDCLQVNFIVNWPQWTTVLTRALETRLTGDPQWRDYAYDVAAGDGRRSAAVQRFASLLAGLREQLAGEDPVALAESLIADARLSEARRASGGGGQ